MSCIGLYTKIPKYMISKITIGSNISKSDRLHTYKLTTEKTAYVIKIETYPSANSLSNKLGIAISI